MKSPKARSPPPTTNCTSVELRPASTAKQDGSIESDEDPDQHRSAANGDASQSNRDTQTLHTAQWQLTPPRPPRDNPDVVGTMDSIFCTMQAHGARIVSERCDYIKRPLERLEEVQLWYLSRVCWRYFNSSEPRVCRWLALTTTTYRHREHPAGISPSRWRVSKNTIVPCENCGLVGGFLPGSSATSI